MSVTEKKGKSPRLGKGLSALIGDLDTVETPTDVPMSSAKVRDLTPNPKQPRKHFSEAELEELAGSIRTHGVIQPILVRPNPDGTPRYQIVAGERRFRAAQRAGLDELPIAIQELDELQVLEIGLVENVQRQDLNPMEEALGYKSLIERFGRTQEALATSVGKSRAHIANTLRLLNLPDDAQAMVLDGKVTAGHARAALASEDPTAFLEKVVKSGLSVRQAEDIARKQSTETSDTTSSVQRDDTKDIDTQALEEDLTRTLGLGVDIRHKKNGGELRIRYRDLEQLDDLCRRLTRPN